MPVDAAKVTDAESAAASSSVAWAPIVAAPEAPARGWLICRAVPGVGIQDRQTPSPFEVLVLNPIRREI